MSETARTFSKELDERTLDESRTSVDSAINRRFESQTTIDLAKQKRQDEWEKVRSAQDPKDVPEEQVDRRCLYDQLKENRDKKDDEFNETNKFGNQIRGIDDSEAKFLEQCSDTIMNVERQRRTEENNAINEFKNAQINKTITLDDKVKKTCIVHPVGSFSSGKTGADKVRSQSSLLSGIVKRKGSATPHTDAKKARTDGDITDVYGVNDDSVKLLPSIDTGVHSGTPTAIPAAMSVVTYSDSSDSNSSTDSDSDINTDIMNYVVKMNHHCAQDCDKH